jgi:Domain of unknown function (DUF305)
MMKAAQPSPGLRMQVESPTAIANGLHREYDGIDYFCGEGCYLDFGDDPERTRSDLCPDDVNLATRASMVASVGVSRRGHRSKLIRGCNRRHLGHVASGVRFRRRYSRRGGHSAALSPQVWNGQRGAPTPSDPHERSLDQTARLPHVPRRAAWKTDSQGGNMDEGRREPASDSSQSRGNAGRYLRFGAMIATSTLVMYVLTYTNVFSIDHIRISEERIYMALLMGAAMAIVMLLYMWGMYQDRRVNIGIIVGALALGAVAFFLSQSQVLVGDTAYMDGMIPHHSIAILTSEHANIEDVRVRELADGIIEAQRREIAEMDWLTADIAANGPATTEAEAQARPVPEFTAEP